MPRIALVAALFFLFASPASAQTLRIFHIDVDQADSALIVMPNGKSLLIDSGNNGHGKRIKKVMAQAGVTQIDAYVTSHYHADHFGGVDDLVEDEVRILESFDRGRRDLVTAADKAKGTYKDYMEAVGEDAHALEPGDTIDLDPLVTIRCIASSGAVIGATTVTSGDENDLSVSILLEFGGFKAFFGGDTHEPVESIMAAGDLVADVDLYKSSHHGSDTSSSVAFMQMVNPTLVVISNGSNGNYKHPRQITLQTYGSLTPPPTVVQTNRCKIAAPCGNVTSEFIADPEQNGKDGTIQIIVDAVARAYVLKYGVSTVRTFSFKSGPPSSPSSMAVIESLLPNPEGNDEQLEEVTIRNAGAVPLNLSGWSLRDRLGEAWALTGLVPSGQSLSFRRNGQAMTLNNGGDEIHLVDDASVERDQFSYAASSEGVRIATNH